MLDEDLNRRTLTESNLEYDLGILVSINLSWEYQVNSAVSKASRSLGLIKSTFKKNWLKSFQNSVYFNDWNPYLKKSINKMEGVRDKDSEKNM